MYFLLNEETDENVCGSVNILEFTEGRMVVTSQIASA